jgi:hypothetical protein
MPPRKLEETRQKGSQPQREDESHLTPTRPHPHPAHATEVTPTQSDPTGRRRRGGYDVRKDGPRARKHHTRGHHRNIDMEYLFSDESGTRNFTTTVSN